MPNKRQAEGKTEENTMVLEECFTPEGCQEKNVLALNTLSFKT